MNTDRKCLDCGEPLLGRIDKKFCNDLCRNNYNNRSKSESNNLIRRINEVLRKNRRILAELNPEEKTTVHKDKLLHRGFNFSYFTSIYTTKNGHVYHFCYEYGYSPIENDYFLLVIRKTSEKSTATS
ncbi:MAG: hypothetical protein M0R21_01900 [Lentimicrobiaceae bacterium]|jgi:hypothetical protein|nr:hypothetical protein [Lentimicrobiaceae bacterium]